MCPSNVIGYLLQYNTVQKVKRDHKTDRQLYRIEWDDNLPDKVTEHSVVIMSLLWCSLILVCPSWALHYCPMCPVMVTNTSSANCYVALSMSYINAVQIGGGVCAVAHVLSIADIIAWFSAMLHALF